MEDTGKRTIWVVDGSYLLKGPKGRFDYLKLKDALEEINGEPFTDSYFLDSTLDPSGAQEAFYTWLKTAPPKGPKMRVKLYKVKTITVHCPSGESIQRHVQKGVDVGIATLIVKLASQNMYDRLILSAGDGDFEDAISFIKEHMYKEVWLCGFQDTISADLQSYANQVVWMDDIWDRIKKPDQPQHGPGGHGGPGGPGGHMGPGSHHGHNGTQDPNTFQGPMR